MVDDHPSFAADVRPLFRPGDIDAMRRARGLDLSSYDQVSAHADAILGRLRAGSMPCDGAWPADQVSLFEKWISGGKQP
jgi:hypothetical protein